MRTQSIVFGVAAFISSLVVACSAQDPTDEARGQAPLGKADALVGSCAGDQSQAPMCGGAGSGQCWCDELCAQYGDCCDDAASECGVDECAGDGDCGSGQSCAEVDGALDCVVAQTCEGKLGEGTVACPPGWRLTPNDAGQAFCLRENVDPDQARSECDALEFPEHARPYCDYADDGYFGYLWDACPAPTEAAVGAQGEQLCVMSPAVLPQGARHYCHYVEDGYFGFYWTLIDDPDYVCPGGMRQSDNGAGAGFCTVSTATMPGPVLAACDDDGARVGFAWGVGCSG